MANEQRSSHGDDFGTYLDDPEGLKVIGEGVEAAVAVVRRNAAVPHESGKCGSNLNF